ncbi:hypothetical protein OH76DRAFT_1408405 [Lentinus brumalis]|uniref:F-box domain-containing protein n=1 Tax=Lentinus brumalis TaxID=2498619 RepID=A0A371CXY0_9APHY|nr:hypothetical protein OH76DRAFT_1408405 [Polyporus brumalis]
MTAELQTASGIRGHILNISDLPTELLINVLSRVSSDTPWRMVDLALVCRAWYAVTKHSSAFWANVVSNTWRFPSLSIISSDALRTRFLGTYASALKRSLPYYLDISLDISQFLELNMSGASKSTLLWMLAPPSKRLVSLSLVISSESDLQQFYDFLSLDLCALEELSLATPPLTLSNFAGAVLVLPLPMPEDLEYRQLPSSALPHLYTLRVTGFLFGPWLARPSLKHLHLVGADATARISDRVRTGGLLLGGLQGCPNLETLEVVNTFPVWTMPYEVPVVDAWPHSHALQKLRSCTVRDEPEWAIKFVKYLHNAPLPASATLDVTLVSPQSSTPSGGPGLSYPHKLPDDMEILFFTEHLCALAFRRRGDTVPIRMELDTALRVYAGDRKRVELKFTPQLLAQSRKRYGLTFPETLVTQIMANPELARTFDDRTLRPEIAELVVDLGDRLTDKLWWQLFFRFFGHVRRLEVRARDALSLFQFLSGKPKDLSADQHLSFLVAARSLPSEEFVEAFTLVGVDFRTQGSDEGEIARMVVDAFVRRKAEGLVVPKEVTLRYRGARRPAFEERVSSGLDGVVRCVVVGSS